MGRFRTLVSHEQYLWCVHGLGSVPITCSETLKKAIRMVQSLSQTHVTMAMRRPHKIESRIQNTVTVLSLPSSETLKRDTRNVPYLSQTNVTRTVAR